MCLLLLSYKVVPDYPLIIAANRDEFYRRPTAPLERWNDRGKKTIFAGRDLEAGGTWLGITEQGRFGALTNFREAEPREALRSRGEVVRSLLEHPGTAEVYLQELQKQGQLYGGFNFLCGSINELLYFSNRRAGIVKLDAGIHGMSNAFLNDPWPKVERGKERLRQVLERGVDVEELFAMLHDTSCPADEELPDTGVGLPWERVLGPMFIASPSYGTRSSAVILFHRSGLIRFYERTFTRDGRCTGQQVVQVRKDV